MALVALLIRRQRQKICTYSHMLFVVVVRSKELETNNCPSHADSLPDSNPQQQLSPVPRS